VAVIVLKTELEPFPTGPGLPPGPPPPPTVIGKAVAVTVILFGAFG
jgi:hypothetical protein